MEKHLQLLIRMPTSIWLKRDKIKFEPYYVKSPLKKLELIFEQTLRGKNLTRNLIAFAKDQGT